MKYKITYNPFKKYYYGYVKKGWFLWHFVGLASTEEETMFKLKEYKAILDKTSESTVREGEL